MLTQEQCDEEEGEQKEEQERLLKARKKRMMMIMTQKRDMKVPRILSHVKSDGRQWRRSWIRILTQTRR